MKHPIHLLIPMSGQGVRFREAGYTDPKPLIPVSGTAMIERLLSVMPSHWSTSFVLAENHADTALPKLLRNLRPSAKQTLISPHKLGPGHALLAGLESIPSEAPVFVSYCDYGMVWDPIHFERFLEESGCDACVVSYRGFHAHYLYDRTYAYSRMQGERVVQVKEKGSFTNNREAEFASSGGYYFRSADLLKKAIVFQMANYLQINGEFYTSLTVEALLQMEPKAHVRIFEIPAFFQWGTPEDVRDFQYWEKAFRTWNRSAGTFLEVEQVLMPMAGLGSRFNNITNAPKPLIPIGDKVMFQAALASLPVAQKVSLVALKSFEDSLRPFMDPKRDFLTSLEKTPPGQAYSTEKGLAALDPSKEVLVTSCDHGIVLQPEIWTEFRNSPQCDAAIFTMKGYPGAARRPLSYSYVVPESPLEKYSPVQRVSVKKNTCADPMDDHVLVGSFWFRSASILKEGIEELKVRNPRVNGELYLDSVFECMKTLGLTVRMIPLEGYVCWGDPDSLAESLYWQEVFGGHRIDRRPRFPGVQAL